MKLGLNRIYYLLRFADSGDDEPDGGAADALKHSEEEDETEAALVGHRENEDGEDQSHNHLNREERRGDHLLKF